MKSEHRSNKKTGTRGCMQSISVPVSFFREKIRFFYTAPCAIMASATFRKPAMFAPAT